MPKLAMANEVTNPFRLNPAMVGGCRPIHIDAFVNPHQWRVVHRSVVTLFGVPSEVLVLATRNTPNNRIEPMALRAATQPGR